MLVPVINVILFMLFYKNFLRHITSNSISKPFQMNVLKQNAKNVPTDNFKTKC